MQIRTTLRFSLLPVDLALIRKVNAGEDKGNNMILSAGMQISPSTMGVHTEIPHKTKNVTTTLSTCI